MTGERSQNVPPTSRRIIVDGANGYVGTNFLRALQGRNGSEEVTCLVRGGPERLTRALGDNAVVASTGDTAIGVAQDYSLTEPSLGLEPRVLNALFADPCDYWHVAAEIDLSSSSPQSLVRTNIEGTRNTVATFSRHAKPGSRYFYVGTAYSGGRSHTAVSEQWHPRASQDAFRTLYEWTKREAELLVKPLAADARFDVAVMRLGQVVGHSVTGDFRTSAGMYEILAATKRLARLRRSSVMRVVADLDASLSLLPIDVCVEWMLSVSESTGWPDPPIYHLVDAAPVSVSRFFRAVSMHAGLEVQAVERGAFTDPTFLERAIDSRLSFAGRYIREPIDVERANLTRLLSDDRPVVTDEVLDRLVRAVFEPDRVGSGQITG